MSRITPSEVSAIIETSLTDSDIEAYISGANVLVTEVLGSNTSLSSELKKQLELWLTAHMIASTREQQLSETEAGPASAKFQGKTGMRLDATLYGQQVLVMDTTGKMAALGGKKASIITVTTPDIDEWGD